MPSENQEIKLPSDVWITTDWNNQGYVYLLDGKIWYLEIEGLKPGEKLKAKKGENVTREVKSCCMDYQDWLEGAKKVGAIATLGSKRLTG